MNKFQPGNEVFNRISGEVMTYVGEHYKFSMRLGVPSADVYAYGYDDYKRVVIWPLNQIERI